MEKTRKTISSNIGTYFDETKIIFENIRNILNEAGYNFGRTDGSKCISIPMELLNGGKEDNKGIDYIVVSEI